MKQRAAIGLFSRVFTILFLVILFFSSQVLLADDNLTIYRNYFITGDYAVSGVGLRGQGVNGLATGSITIPDGVNSQPDANQPNAGVVPPGASVVAAFLYWQTVESSQTTFAGQSGFFNHHPINGIRLGNDNAPVSWSAGGCSGSSNGTKTIRTYRQDVRPYLNLDQYGNIVGSGTYEVKLPDSGSNGGGAPLTLGATLVVIYRTLSQSAPLTSIVLYDGVYAPSNAGTLMSQQIQGFYEAAASPTAKITHIVGNGQSNKVQYAYLKNILRNTKTLLPSLYTNIYGSNAPAFPGYYNQSWDNPTWLVNNYLPAPVMGEDFAETTTVEPAPTNSGCVTWGAVVFSSTVQDTDRDGLLDAWETGANPGYTDIASGNWVPLPGANPNAKDLFVELDYLKTPITQNPDGSYTGHSHLPKQQALDKVGEAFCKAGVKVHFDVGNVYQTAPSGATYTCLPSVGSTDPYIIPYTAATAGGNAIPESAVVCTEGSGTPYCTYPNQAVIGWKAGLLYVKDNPSVPQSNPAIPLGNFQLGRGNSYHYVLFAHTLGSAKYYWSTAATQLPTLGLGVLQSIDATMSPAIVNIKSPADFPALALTGNPLLDRITVTGATGQPALNGTYALTNTITTPDANNGQTFTITLPPNVDPGIYNFTNEPQLGLGYGGPTPMSGYSDVGGADSMITFGLWPADDDLKCQPDPSLPLGSSPSYCDNQVGNYQAQAGTLMHEMGHTFALTHGGRFFTNGVQSYGPNCKANFLSVMNYLFQIRGFPDGAIDYSGQTLADISESSLDESIGLGTTPAAAHPTRWYGPPSALDLILGLDSRLPKIHCDGTPRPYPWPANVPYVVRIDGTTLGAPAIDWNNDGIVPNFPGWIDVDFNGSTQNAPDPTFKGYSDWANFDLQQIGARWNVMGQSGSAASLGGGSAASLGGGSAASLGGGSAASLGGGSAASLGGGSPLEQGGGSAASLGGGSAASLGGGSAASLGGGNSEVDFGIANSTVDPPVNFTAANNPANNSVKLTWFRPAFGQIRSYYIYRLTGPVSSTNPITNAVKLKLTAPGLPLQTPYTLYDTTVKNKTTYVYFVVSALADGSQSAASTPSTVTTKF